MNTNQEDIQLIQGVINKDTNSQNKLYNKYTAYVKNFLRKNYITHYDLDDDVAEILIKIFTNIHTFDSNKSLFTSWVCTIAKNHMIDKWRSNNISYMLTTSNSGNYITSSTSYVNTIDDNEFNVGDSISVTSTNTDFMAYTFNSLTTEYEACDTTMFVTSELSSCDYTFLHMKYVYGYDYNEIGSEFNVSSNTVSNRVNYIKNKLKKQMAEMIK